jgi:hypothetical protein
MGVLLTPREQAPIQVDLFEACLIDESPELPHPTTVKPAIVLVFNPIDRVEVTC